MATPNALKRPTQRDTHQKEDEPQQAERTQGQLAAISHGEPSGKYVRAYYATRRHLIDFAAINTRRNTKRILSDNVYTDTAHYTYIP